MTIHLRQAGSSVWQQVDYNTKKLRLSGGDAEAVPHLPGEMMVSGLSFAGFWEAAVSAYNTVGWGAMSPVSNAAVVCSPMAPPAPSVPLLEAVGLGQLRVRWATPPAEPPCTWVTIRLRQAGSSAWQQADGKTKKLVGDGVGSAVPSRAGEIVVSGLSAGSWEARMDAYNTVGWGAMSPVSNSVPVRSPSVPPAPSAPLLEAVGQGQLRVRWAAPAAEPPCTWMAINLRKAGSSAWQQVDYKTKKLGLSDGDFVPSLLGEIVVSGLSAGSWEAILEAYNPVGWGTTSPICPCTTLVNDDDDDGVAVVGSLSWAERDQALRKRAIDLDDAEPQDTKQVQKRHKSRVGARCPAKSE